MNNRIIVLLLVTLFLFQSVFCASIIQIRRDTAANWITADSNLAQGELGFEMDTYKLKIGDGVTSWGSLAYYSTGTISGGVYTSGTPATLEVNNDTNTISLDFDGNFNLRTWNTDFNANWINLYNDQTLPAGGLTWTLLDSILPLADANVANDISLTNITQITNRAFSDISSKNFSLLTLDNNNSFDARYNLTSDSNNTARLLYSVIADPPFISSTTQWDSNFALNVWNTDFNANWLDLFTGQNNSLLTNDSGYITSYSDTNAGTACVAGQVLTGDNSCSTFAIIDSNYATEGYDFGDYTLQSLLYSVTQTIFDGNFLKTGDWIGTLDGYEASELLLDTNAATACGVGQVLGGDGDGCVDLNALVGNLTEVYYPTDQNSDVATYEVLQSFPDPNSESDSVSVDSGIGRVLIDQYMTAPNNPFVTVIPAGTYEFHNYLSISSDAGETFFDVNVYRYTVGGEVIPLFGDTTEEVNGAVSTRYVINHVLTEAQDINITDRLIIRWYVRNNHATEKTATLYYGGADAYTHVHTSIPRGGDSGFVRYVGSTKNLVMPDYNVTADKFFGDGSALTGITHTIDTNVWTVGYLDDFNAVTVDGNFLQDVYVDEKVYVDDIWDNGQGHIDVGTSVYIDNLWVNNSTFLKDLNAFDVNATNFYGGNYYGTWLGNAIGIAYLNSTVMIEGENVSLLTNDSGYITSYIDSTLDSNNTAETSWLGKTHSFTVDQNFVNIQATNFFGTKYTSGNATWINGAFSGVTTIDSDAINSSATITGVDGNFTENLYANDLNVGNNVQIDNNISVNTICFPSLDNCQATIDYNGSAIIISG